MAHARVINLCELVYYSCDVYDGMRLFASEGGFPMQNGFYVLNMIMSINWSAVSHEPC